MNRALSKKLKKLSREELETVVYNVFFHLYSEGPETEWESETVESVASVLHALGLKPGLARSWK